MKINLIPQEEKKVNIWAPIIKTLGISLLTVFVLAGILTTRYFINQLNFNSLLEKEKSIASQEESLRDFRESFEKYRNSQALTLLNNHIYYSKLFGTLEGTIPSKLRFISISINEDYKAVLDAEVFGGYADVSRFSKSLKKAGFFTTIKTAFTTGDKVRFSIEFTFPKEMIKK